MGKLGLGTRFMKAQSMIFEQINLGSFLRYSLRNDYLRRLLPCSFI